MRYAIAILVTCLSFALVHQADARDRSGVFKASQLMGMNVLGTDGKTWAISGSGHQSGRRGHRLCGARFWRVPGHQDKYFAIPWDALQVATDKSHILIDATKRDLKQARGSTRATGRISAIWRRPPLSMSSTGPRAQCERRAQRSPGKGRVPCF